jgi:hypothetical protein
MNNSFVSALGTIAASLLLVGAAPLAQAYSITTTNSKYESGGVRYYFEVRNWTTGDTGYSPCVSSDLQLTTCHIFLGLRLPGSMLSVGKDYEWRFPIRRGSSNLGQLLSDLQGQGFSIPFSGSILVPSESASNDLCVGFGSARTGVNIAGGISYFGPCISVATATVDCKITGNTTIDHKSLADNALDGAKASTQLYLHCQGVTTVTVSTSRSNYNGVMLRKDGSLYSTLTINGKDAFTGIDVQVSGGQFSPLSITSTLKSNGTVAPGGFSASSVITVSPL